MAVRRWKKGKRHPTLHDGVIVGSGAQVLGPLTLGEGARVGANAVVLNDVPKGVTVVGIPARMIMRENVEDEQFVAYGQPKADLPDPVARSIDTLRQQVSALMERIDELEGKEGSDEEPSSGKVKKLAAGAGKKR